MSAIEVQNLVKRYRKAKTNAVDDISFTIPEGKFVAFLGPNGAGKTTTISVLTTTLAKTSGTVKIAGFDSEKDSHKIRSQIGIIFQKPSLDENLTAEENVRFHAVLYGLYPFSFTFGTMPKAYRERVTELAGLLGIDQDLGKPIKTFSGGMKRKLEIIRSLMHNPRILFLDEPTTGLDPASRKSLWEYLQQVRREQGTTIFLTTHYLEEAEGADQVIVVNHGAIAANGTPQEIKSKLVENFVTVGAGDRAALETDIRQAGYTFRPGKQGDFDVTITDEGPSIQKLLGALQNIQLTKIETHTPTLEEAYLELITPKNVEPEDLLATENLEQNA